MSSPEQPRTISQKSFVGQCLEGIRLKIAKIGSVTIDVAAPPGTTIDHTAQSFYIKWDYEQRTLLLGKTDSIKTRSTPPTIHSSIRWIFQKVDQFNNVLKTTDTLPVQGQAYSGGEPIQFTSNRSKILLSISQQGGTFIFQEVPRTVVEEMEIEKPMDEDDKVYYVKKVDAAKGDDLVTQGKVSFQQANQHGGGKSKKRRSSTPTRFMVC